MYNSKVEQFFILKIVRFFQQKKQGLYALKIMSSGAKDDDDDDDIIEKIEKRKTLLQWKLILQYLMINLCTMAIVLIVVTYGMDLFRTLINQEPKISINIDDFNDTINTTEKRFEPTNRTLVLMITIIAMIIFIIVFLMGIIAVMIDHHRHIMTIFLGLMVANFSGCLAVGYIRGGNHRWHFWPVSFISFTLICLSSSHIAINYKIEQLPDYDGFSSSLETQPNGMPFILVDKKNRKKNNHRHRLFETTSLDSINSEQSLNSNPSSV